METAERLDALIKVRSYLEGLYDVSDFSIEKASNELDYRKLSRKVNIQSSMFLFKMLSFVAMPLLLSMPANPDSLFGRILGMLRPVSILPFMTSLSNTSRYSVGLLANQYGGRLVPGWGNPLSMIQSVFPSIFEATTERVEGSKETFAHRIANTIAARETNDPAVIKNVLRKQARVQARTLGNTEESQSRNAIRQQVMKDYGIARRRLRPVSDGKTDILCLKDAAAGWIPIDQPYPSGVMYPPQQHPNCRCTEEADRSQIVRIPSYLGG